MLPPSALEAHSPRRARNKRGRAPPRFTPLLGERLEERALLSIAAQLLTDINTTPAGVEVAGSIVELQGVAYFPGIEGTTGTELWRSDGTKAGTFLVKDIRPGVDGSSPLYLINVNGTLFFSA